MSAVALAPARGSQGFHLTRRGRAIRSIGMLILGSLVVFVIGRAAPAVAVRSVQGAFASTPITGVTVEVEEGDSLWLIARRALPDRDPRSVITDIRMLNHLSSNLIHPGQVLLVPAN